VSSKAQRRSEAVAQRKRAADAAADRRRRNRLALWGGLAAVVVVAIIVAVASSGGGGGNGGAKASSFETHAVTVDGTPLPKYDSSFAGTGKDPALGKTIPTLTGVSVLDGKPVTVRPTGKPQMVVFVAHWCPHCQAEVPRLVQLAKGGTFDGVDVTAVATGTNADAPNYPPSTWLKGEQWPFAAMADSADGTAATAYGISAYPYFVLVNADGTVAARATGEVPPDQIKANVDALKAGQPLPLLSSGASSAS
jgi:cytochrome c biogenesis protein CcmG/thiol:disulfide interchange protein DsbE